MTKNVLVFGASGSLGITIRKYLIRDGFQVFTAGGGTGIDSQKHLTIDYKKDVPENLFTSLPSLDAVVWAHGINCSDSILDFDISALERLWKANVVFIASTQASLIKNKKINLGSRLVIVSSIWQLESRSCKFSYTISKAALQGLVKSCAIDLGKRGILINAILPGVIDTPMTRSNLSDSQISAIIDQTALRRLAEPEDIASAVSFLAGSANRSITGQFLTIDCGFIGLKIS